MGQIKSQLFRVKSIYENMYRIPYISNKRTEHYRIWKLLFPHSYTGKGLDAFGVSAFTCVLVRKKKPPRSNKGQFFCLKCTVSYT